MVIDLVKDQQKDGPMTTDSWGCTLPEAVQLAPDKKKWRQITGLNSLHGPQGLINKWINEFCNNFFWTRLDEICSPHPNSPPMQLSCPTTATVSMYYNALVYPHKEMHVYVKNDELAGKIPIVVLRKMNFTRLTSEVDCHILDWETSGDTSLLSSCTAWTCTACYRRQQQMWLNLFIKQFLNTHHHWYLDTIHSNLFFFFTGLLLSQEGSRKTFSWLLIPCCSV